MYEGYLKNTIPLKKVNFQKIINFYLFHCPVDGTSARARTFATQGWHSHYLATFKSFLLKRATDNLRKYYFPCKKDELNEKYRVVEEEVGFGGEYCVFLKRDEKNAIQSLFSAIRNAFAHGEFAVITRNKITIYYFLNNDGYTKAQIVLLEDTLLKWIDIFNSEPESLKRENNRRAA